MNSERYGTGHDLPEFHPDPQMNADLQIELLCAHLDLARQTLVRVLDMNVVTPAALSMKDSVRFTLSETSPKHFGTHSRSSDREPPEPDGECFRGGEAAAFLRDQQIEAQRLK